ncbi:MAG: putative transrane efflux protein [Planctomycetaceae bacterium]|nr:putative transrane efflux protein [Planctomycetaceae bacterium]
MTQVTTMSPPPQSHPAQAPVASAGPAPWMAAVAIVPILATVYQTLVLTDVTDDVIRTGIQAEHYAMIWTNACWGFAFVYGVFAGIWAMARVGPRNALVVGLIWFAVGNLMCGAATDVTTLAIAKLVEGIGKGMVSMLCRSLLYRQFDRMVIVAIGFYGLCAYATRPTTPLLTSMVNDALSWRWIFWINVPLALLAIPLVRRCIKPDRPAQPLPLRIDWVGVTLFAIWAVSLTFTFGWYRKWGGWTSNAFTVTALLALLLPIPLVAWVGSGFSASEHFRRMFRVRIYVLAMCVRMLLLVQLLVVLTLMSKYCIALRDYPRLTTGWILAPATLAMAVSTFLTTRFHVRSLRHFWLFIGFVGCAACLWWMSSVDNFTSKGGVALMIACWGLFLGLLPPSFLQDEVESLDRRDSLYAGALAVVVMFVPLVIIPSATSTIVSAWTDRALDAQRLNLQQNRPEVEASSARVADYYRQRGVGASDLNHMTSTVLGAFAKVESVAHGIQSGLRFLSLVVGGLGLLVTFLLVRGTAAKAP